VAIVAVKAAIAGPSAARALTDVAVPIWGLGVALYLLVTALIVLRWLSQPVAPAELRPTTWILMGATAISVLAGSTILHASHALPAVHAAAALIEGTDLVLWGVGTWFIPLLVALGVWRHLLRRVPLSYEVGLWSIVFPIGMYAAASASSAGVSGLPFLISVARVSLWVGVTASVIVVMLMVRAGMTSLRAAHRRAPGGAPPLLGWPARSGNVGVPGESSDP
jgi:tellurite resistance protein TehA-like permease